jgi:hypothetical protein
MHHMHGDDDHGPFGGSGKGDRSGPWGDDDAEGEDGEDADGETEDASA